MTTEHEEPERLFDALSREADRAGDDLRRALREARGDTPAEARLDAIFARLPRGEGGGGGGGGGAPPAPIVIPKNGPGVAGVALAAAGVALVGGAIYFAARGPSAPTSVPSGAPTGSDVALVAPPPSTDRSASVVLEAPPSSSSPAPTAPVIPALPTSSPAVSTSASAAPARPEADILREAQASVSSNPSRALALCDEHARSYPSGVLSQEREVIRVQALMAAGRAGEARAIVDAFAARHPGSAHAERLRDIVGR